MPTSHSSRLTPDELAARATLVAAQGPVLGRDEDRMVAGQVWPAAHRLQSVAEIDRELLRLEQQLTRTRRATAVARTVPLGVGAIAIWILVAEMLHHTWVTLCAIVVCLACLSVVVVRTVTTMRTARALLEIRERYQRRRLDLTHTTTHP